MVFFTIVKACKIDVLELPELNDLFSSEREFESFTLKTEVENKVEILPNL